MPACTVTKLRIELSGSPGAGQSYTFTLRKNNLDTAMTDSIADAAAEVTITGSVAYAENDDATLKIEPSAAPTARNWRGRIEFTLA